MRDLKKYWRDVREMERNLPSDLWLMSLEDSWRGLTGGVLSEVPAAEAAKLLYAKSHRAATAEEISAHVGNRSAAAREEFHANLRRRGIMIVPVEERAMPGEGTSEGNAKARTRNLR